MSCREHQPECLPDVHGEETDESAGLAIKHKRDKTHGRGPSFLVFKGDVQLQRGECTRLIAGLQGTEAISTAPGEKHTHQTRTHAHTCIHAHMHVGTAPERRPVRLW